MSPSEALDQFLSSPASQDPAGLFPTIVPDTLLSPEWPGPIERIGDLPFALAWVVHGGECEGGNLLNYVSHELASYWDGQALDWRARAFANLARLSEELPANGSKADEDGVPFIAVMLHPDALGPSRLLLPRLFEDVLGRDYRVAIPEQTCAIAWRGELTAAQRADVEAMVDGCFRNGTEPVSPDSFAASAFWSAAERYA
jgi:hypothetical protein